MLYRLQFFRVGGGAVMHMDAPSAFPAISMGQIVRVPNIQPMQVASVGHVFLQDGGGQMWAVTQVGVVPPAAHLDAHVGAQLPSP